MDDGSKFACSRSIALSDLFRSFFFPAAWMRSHVAIARIKEQAAANDCAEHDQGHGVIVPPRAKRKNSASLKSERRRSYNENFRAQTAGRAISEYLCRTSKPPNRGQTRHRRSYAGMPQVITQDGGRDNQVQFNIERYRISACKY